MPDTDAFPWISTLISLMSAAVAWAGALVSWKNVCVSHQLAMDREYAQLAGARENFWSALSEAYNRFRSSRGELPDKLEALITAAGPPPGLPRPPGRHMRTWAAEEKHRFGPDQRDLWYFSCSVYPPYDDGRIGEITDFTLIKREEAPAFQKAQGDLAQFWNAWVPAIGRRRILKRFEAQRLEIVILSWLEPALVGWNQDEGGGKKDLFRLAQRIKRS